MSQAIQRKIKVGIVGCGVVATAYYLPYLMDHADLVAVCDLDAERTAACMRLFDAKEQYQDYTEVNYPRLKHMGLSLALQSKTRLYLSHQVG